MSKSTTGAVSNVIDQMSKALYFPCPCTRARSQPVKSREDIDRIRGFGEVEQSSAVDPTRCWVAWATHLQKVLGMGPATSREDEAAADTGLALAAGAEPDLETVSFDIFVP